MSDETREIFQAMKQHSKEKREANKYQSMKWLEAAGIEYQILSPHGPHLRIGSYDFWPTTGKYINRLTKKTGRGILNLLKNIRGK